MKKNWALILMFFWMLGSHAAVELPQSVTLESGTLKVRLDSRKYCFMNRIEWKNRLVCIDHPGAHYGTVFNIAGTQGFVGSGHTETGYKEEVQSLKILIDGKSVDYLKENTFKGRDIRVNKISKVRDFLVTYELTLANDQIYERVEVTSSADVKLNMMYHFMHPWSTAFTDLYYRRANGTEKTFEFKTDNNFPLYEDAPVAAWYNRNTGEGVVTLVFPGKGQKQRVRYIWDSVICNLLCES